MTTPIRISVEEARQKTQAGQAFLVCGYEGADKFVANQLEGAISWETFQSRLPEISKQQEIIFYCA